SWLWFINAAVQPAVFRSSARLTTTIPTYSYTTRRLAGFGSGTAAQLGPGKRQPTLESSVGIRPLAALHSALPDECEEPTPSGVQSRRRACFLPNAAPIGTRPPLENGAG